MRSLPVPPPDLPLVPPSPSDHLLVLCVTLRPSSCPLCCPSSCRAPHLPPRCRGVWVNRGRVAPCEPRNPKPHPRGAGGGGHGRGSRLESASAAPGGSPRGPGAPGSASGGCGMPCGDPPVLCPVRPAGPGSAGGIPGASSPGMIPGVAAPPLPGAPAPVPRGWRWRSRAPGEAVAPSRLLPGRQGKAEPPPPPPNNSAAGPGRDGNAAAAGTGPRAALNRHWRRRREPRA